MSDNNHEKLLPDFVMVHPLSENDPLGRQGEIGVITAAILNTDEFYIGFDDHEVGLYSADALLTFRPSDQIYLRLKNEVMALSPGSFKDLKNIALLLDYGSADQQRKALEIVQKNPAVIERIMISLEERLGIKTDYKRGR